MSLQYHYNTIENTQQVIREFAKTDGLWYNSLS